MANVPTNKEQDEAHGHIFEGHYLLITGQAGTGKTQTIKSVYHDLKACDKNIALLCTTGIGFLQYVEIGATTVHSYRCLKPQHLEMKGNSSYSAHRIWMISKCDPLRQDLLTGGIEELCENPGPNRTIESLVPVRHSCLQEVIVYRNRYCAYCNNVPADCMKSWNIRVYCPMILETNKAVLNALNDGACNVVYEDDSKPSAEICNIPDYRIDRCNMTGLWQEYNKTIEQACNSFLDPFNASYKNIFCYFCNSGENSLKDEWNCPNPISESDDESSLFSLTLNVDDLAVLRHEELNCDLQTQFLDYKQKKCRDYLCHGDRQLSGHNYCELTEGVGGKESCFSTFVKIIPLIKKTVSPNWLKETNFTNEIKLLIESNVELAEDFIMEVQLFVNSELLESPSKQVDYIVARLVLDTNATDLYLFMLGIHKQVIGIEVEGTRGTIHFYLFVTLYDEIGNSVYVPSQKRFSVDEFRPISILNFQPDGECKRYHSVLFHKLHYCMFLNIGEDEFSLSVQNGFLIFKNDNFNATFDKFEYQLQRDSINICFEDFLIFYDTLPSRLQHSKSGGEKFPLPNKIWLLLLKTCILMHLRM